MDIDINNLSGYRENNRIEAKKAKGGLPGSLWETYSSFANTDGGIILLGVDEKDDHSFVVSGVGDAHKLKTDFWNMVNNRQKISLNVLTNEMVHEQEVEGKSILVIRVPKADRRQKPVYVGQDPMRGTYRRDFEGDHLCTQDEVSAMYRDASDRSLDLKVLKSMDMTVFDMDTVHKYRNRFRQFHPAHVWNDDNDEVFLRRIGAMAVCEEDMKFHPTAAGLLMFGREYDIVREFPDYFLDYQEKDNSGARWVSRITSISGDWSGNLYDFFFRVYPRITSDLPVPFVAKGMDRVDETALHLALREVLLNICAHADHYGRQGIVIIKDVNSMTFTNPGDIRVGLNVALSGGISDPRNVTVMKMFGLVDIGERAGSGIPDFINTWQKYVEFNPEYEITRNPDRTKLTIPYTIAALQKAGSKLVDGVQVENSDTTETSSDTRKSNSDTNISSETRDKKQEQGINEAKARDKDVKQGINAHIEPKARDKILQIKGINEKTRDKLLLMIEYMLEHRVVKNREIAELLSVGDDRARVLLMLLVENGVLIAKGDKKERTYAWKAEYIPGLKT